MMASDPASGGGRGPGPALRRRGAPDRHHRPQRRRRHTRFGDADPLVRPNWARWVAGASIHPPIHPPKSSDEATDRRHHGQARPIRRRPRMKKGRHRHSRQPPPMRGAMTSITVRRRAWSWLVAALRGTDPPPIAPALVVGAADGPIVFQNSRVVDARARSPRDRGVAPRRHRHAARTDRDRHGAGRHRPRLRPKPAPGTDSGSNGTMAGAVEAGDGGAAPPSTPGGGRTSGEERRDDATFPAGSAPSPAAHATGDGAVARRRPDRHRRLGRASRARGPTPAAALAASGSNRAPRAAAARPSSAGSLGARHPPRTRSAWRPTPSSTPSSSRSPAARWRSGKPRDRSGPHAPRHDARAGAGRPGRGRGRGGRVANGCGDPHGLGVPEGCPIRAFTGGNRHRHPRPATGRPFRWSSRRTAGRVREGERRSQASRNGPMLRSSPSPIPGRRHSAYPRRPSAGPRADHVPHRAPRRTPARGRASPEPTGQREERPGIVVAGGVAAA